MIASTSAIAADLGCFLFEARRRPFGVAPVRARHVLGDRGVMKNVSRSDEKSPFIASIRVTRRSP
jgi:hypothetical protein